MKKLALFFCLLAGCCCDEKEKELPLPIFPRTKIGTIDGGSGRTLYKVTIEGHDYFFVYDGSIGPEIPQLKAEK